jgi:hypothetical protein
LIVNDLPVPNGREVLSDFSNKSTRRLGEIPFSLEEKIEANFQQLRHNPDLTNFQNLSNLQPAKN